MIARLAAEVKDHDGIDLQLRVGLNSGQVIAGEIGSGPFGYTACRGAHTNQRGRPRTCGRIEAQRWELCSRGLLQQSVSCTSRAVDLIPRLARARERIHEHSYRHLMW
jgi:hypothetical protein